MTKSRLFYRGKRKYGWILTLVLLIIALLIIAAVFLFYYLQQFIVYDKDGLHLDLSGDTTPVPAAIEDISTSSAGVGPVEVEIIMDRPDYSDVKTDAGTGLSAVRGLWIGADSVNPMNIAYYASNMGDKNTLLLELMRSDGTLVWNSGVTLASSYGLNGSVEIKDAITAAKESSDCSFAAMIYATENPNMALRNGPLALKSLNGSVMTVGSSCWMDPYSEATRSYLYALMHELKNIGFDEIVFAGFTFPVQQSPVYSREMTGSPEGTDAMCSLAFYLREKADELGIRISLLTNTEKLRKGECENIGQALENLYLAFDRILFETDSYQVGSDAQLLYDATGSGDTKRVVAILEDYAPDVCGYVLK